MPTCIPIAQVVGTLQITLYAEVAEAVGVFIFAAKVLIPGYQLVPRITLERELEVSLPYVRDTVLAIAEAGMWL